MSVPDGVMGAAGDYKDCNHDPGEQPFPQNGCVPKGAREREVLGKLFVVSDGKEKIMSGITIAMLIIYAVVFGGGSFFMISKSMSKKNDPGAEIETAEKKQDGFGSRIGFILSTIGLAVGVGAMWRFPMMCAQWGGGAFVLAFVVVCIVIVLPAGWADLACGRHFKKGTVGSCGAAGGKPGKVLGWMMSIDQLCLFGYYPAIMALVLCYVFKSFGGMDYADKAEVVFEQTNDNRLVIYLLVIAVIIVVGLISLRGIEKGIEKMCKILLPMLFIILIVLVVRVCMIPGIAEGIEYYIKPDWSQLANPQMWAAAAGMALFAVGLGPGPLLSYSRYVNDKQDIATDFITVNIVQLFICLLGGFVIIPAVKIFGLDPTMGKGVMFVALPKVFETMPGGAIFMILFFVALIFAGISSSINQLEVGISALMDKEGGNLKRGKAILLAGVAAAIIAIPCVWSDSFFAVFDNVIGNIGYCICGLGLAIILAWKVGAKKVREEWYLPTSAIKWGSWVDFLYKYVAVLALGYFTVTAIISLF